MVVADKGSYHCSRLTRLRRMTRLFERSCRGNRALPLPGKPEAECVRPTLQLSDSACRFLIQSFLNGEMLMRSTKSSSDHRARLVRQHRWIFLLSATHNISCCRGRQDCLGQASERYEHSYARSTVSTTASRICICHGQPRRSKSGDPAQRNTFTAELQCASECALLLRTFYP